MKSIYTLIILLVSLIIFNSCNKDDDDVVPESLNTWTKTFGGTNNKSEGFSVQQTTDGGYIISGYKHEFGNGEYDVYLIKTDENGDSLWTKTFGGTEIEHGYSVKETTDGGYIITGNKFPYVYLIKTDENGDSLWTKTFSNGGNGIEHGYSVEQTTDGGYIITGNTVPFGSGQEDIYLIKTDGNGDSLWTKTFGGTDIDIGYSGQQTTDGGYIITGRTSSFGNGDGDVCLIKTDQSGNEQWFKTFGGINYEDGYSGQQTTDGGYIITGITNSVVNGNVYLIKTDENGDSLWTKTFGGTGYSRGYSVQQTTDGGYVITGLTDVFGSGGWDVYLIKTDGSGNEQWTKTFGGTNYDQGNSVQQTTDGGYIITGYTRSFGNLESNVFLIKTDGNGDVNP